MPSRLAMTLVLLLGLPSIASSSVHLQDGAVVDGIPVLRSRNGDLFILADAGRRPTRIAAGARSPLIFDGNDLWTSRSDPRSGRDLLRVSVSPPRVEAFPVVASGRFSPVASDGTTLYLQDGWRVSIADIGRASAAAPVVARAGHLDAFPGWSVVAAIARPAPLLLVHDPSDPDPRGQLLLLRHDEGRACWEKRAVGEGGSGRLVADEHEVLVQVGGLVHRFDASTLARLPRLGLPTPMSASVVSLDANATWCHARERTQATLWRRDRSVENATWRPAATLPRGMEVIGFGAGRAWFANIRDPAGPRLVFVDGLDSIHAGALAAIHDTGSLRRPRPLLGLARAMRTAAVVALYAPAVPLALVSMIGESGARGNAGAASTAPKAPESADPDHSMPGVAPQCEPAEP